MAIILDISETIEPQIIQDASIPYFNNIMILNGDTLDIDGIGIFYGDEINLMFWGALNLVFDSGRVYENTYTLIPGYIYRYYVGNHLFRIYDDTGNIIFVNNIVGINDFCIDFSVHKSHQFEIYNLSEDYNIGFYKPVKWRKRIHNSVRANFGDVGVDNLWEPDRVRPYGASDDDNPITGGVPYRLHKFIDIAKGLSDGDGYEYGKGVNSLKGIVSSLVDYSNVNINNCMYTEIPLSLEGLIPDWDIYGKKHDYNSIVIPLLSKNMFPALLPIQLLDQQTNNRPVYEPWLIWKTLDFMASGTVFDRDLTDLEAYTFDLSPWWA